MKFFYCFFSLLFLISPVFADSFLISASEMQEVEEFFNSYVDSANNYRDNLQDKYSPDAEIKRVVIKPDDTKETVIIPIDRYFKELKSGKKLAKLVRYKNKYINTQYEKIQEDEYKVKTTRIPFRNKTGLNAYFIVKKTPDGYKIIEESMETNVQKFLSEK